MKSDKKAYFIIFIILTSFFIIPAVYALPNNHIKIKLAVSPTRVIQDHEIKIQASLEDIFKGKKHDRKKNKIKTICRCLYFTTKRQRCKL